MSNIRILIADDHAVVRRGLSLMLNQERDFQVVGEAADGQEAVSMAFDIVPDIVLLDWKMPRMDGISAAGHIRRQIATTRILILSGAPVEDPVLDALDEGVDGFVSKDIGPADLAHAIRVVAGGDPYLGPDITRALIDRSRLASNTEEEPINLSQRELEVLELMATPATYRQIAEQLFVGEETVRTYAKRIMAKLDEPNRTQAVIAGIRAGLISLE